MKKGSRKTRIAYSKSGNKKTHELTHYSSEREPPQGLSHHSTRAVKYNRLQPYVSLNQLPLSCQSLLPRRHSLSLRIVYPYDLRPRKHPHGATGDQPRTLQDPSSALPSLLRGQNLTLRHEPPSASAPVPLPASWSKRFEPQEYLMHWEFQAPAKL